MKKAGTIIGILVNIGCDFHVSSPVCQTGAVHVLLHMQVITPDIDNMDSMKYILGSAYKMKTGRIYGISSTFPIHCVLPWTSPFYL